MKTDIEILLEASIKLELMRKALEEMTAALAEVIKENDLLRAERDFLELKLMRLTQPRLRDVELTGRQV